MSKKNKILIKIHKEINNFQNFLLLKGLITRYNPSIILNNTVTWKNSKNLSVLMKEGSYEEIYNILDRSKNFSFQLIDGAIFQMSYSVDKDISKIRMAYYPSPNLLNLDEAITEYICGDEFIDMLDKYIVAIPIRIDYAPKQHTDVIHPKTHLHLGQIEGCRIPLISPIMPNKFLKFIFYNFYNKIYSKYLKIYNFDTETLGISITDNEKKHGHIYI